MPDGGHLRRHDRGSSPWPAGGGVADHSSESCPDGNSGDIAFAGTVGAVAYLGVVLAPVVVPLAAPSPAPAGLLGIFFLREPTSRRQLAGIALALAGALLLATEG